MIPGADLKRNRSDSILTREAMPVSKRQRLRGETDLNNQQADKQKAKAMLLEFKEAKKQ